MKTRQFMRSLLAVATLAGSFTIAGRSASADPGRIETLRVAGDVPSSLVQDVGGIAVDVNDPLDDADDVVYVSDRSANRIVKFVPLNGSGWTMITSSLGGGEGLSQVNYPGALHIDAAGALYISDTGNNRILKWEEGATSATIVAGGMGYGSSLDQLSNPGQIGFGDDGEMYVVDTDNSRVMRYDTLGQGVTGAVVAGGTWGSGLSDFDVPQGIIVGPGTNPALYISDGFNNRIMKWTQGAAAGEVYAGLGIDPPTRLSFPGQMFKDDNGMYVADTYNNRVVHINEQVNPDESITTYFDTIAGTVGTGDEWASNWTRSPRAIHVVGDTVFVAEADRVSRWVKSDIAGVVVMGPNAAPQPVVSSSATVISVGEDGLTYIADGNTVLALDPFAGVTVPMFTPAASGTGLDAVGFIEGLHVTADGSMYISDSVFNRVVKWTPGGTTGELIAGWDGNGTSQDFGKGDGLGQLWAPRGLDMGADGALYVADVLNNRVMRYAGNGDGTFAAAGSIVAGGNGSGSNLNQLWSPYDVKVGVSGDLFISDTTNHRIVRVASNGDGTFAAAGTIAAGGNDTGFAANQVSDPQYIAVDAAEGVYYSSAKTGLVHHWAAGATEATLVYGGAELGRALGVDVDASGRAWALDFHYRGVVAQVIDAELSIATIPTGTLGDASVAVPLTQRNGADAQITTMTPAVCDIQFGRVRMLAVGTCTVKASKSGYLWTTAETTASFSIVAAPTTTTAPPTTTVPPTTVPPTTQAPTTTVPATTPPTTQAPTTTVPATTPPTTQAPTTTVPAVPSKALKATCKASGKSVKCTVSKPAGVAKATKVFYQAVCIAGTAVKSTSVRSAATKVTLTIKTTKGSWKCSLTAISGTSRWTKSASVKTR